MSNSLIKKGLLKKNKQKKQKGEYQLSIPSSIAETIDDNLVDFCKTYQYHDLSQELLLQT